MTALLFSMTAIKATDVFETLSIKPHIIAHSTASKLIMFRYLHDGKEDHALIDERPSPTWVVYFHSYGGSAEEIFTSPLIHPLWLDAVRAAGFGLVSFETDGNSWMAPYVADGIHNALAAIREKYHVKNFIFIGGSMGGSAVLIYSVRYPEDVFAALAMCPVSDMARFYEDSLQNPDPNFFMKSWPIDRYYGETKSLQQASFDMNSVQGNVEKLNMPLVISHGTADPLIDVSQSDNLAKRLEGKTDFKYFRYEGADHSYPSVQGFKDSWPWLLERVNERLRQTSGQ